jgi:hypothetical protein
MSKINILTFRLRVTAIFLIAAGYGWAGGHFIPAGSPFMAYLFQGVILLILLILSLGFFNQPDLPHTRWALRGLSIFAILTLLINIANIIRGFTNNGANTFGSHNTPADLVPICIILIGNVLWLTSFLGRKD